MKTTIKKDAKGLYVRCDEWVARSPLTPTRFSEGADVVASHPPGGAIYVRGEDEPHSDRELWLITLPWWWHVTEGAGEEGEKLRKKDVEASPNIYSELYEAFHRGECHG
jgi:hypothetical protein